MRNPLEVMKSKDSELEKTWAEHLAFRLGRSVDEIRNLGLSCRDFLYNCVRLTFDDGSFAEFKDAFSCINKEDETVAVFTDHCGHFEFVLGVLIEVIEFQRRKGKLFHESYYCYLPWCTDAQSNWVRNIEKQSQLIETWRTELSRLGELAENWIYIRVGSSGYRPISIAPENPCGRLIQRTKKTVIGNFAKLSTAIKNAKDAEKPNSPNSYKPGNAKPEHRMQATLIRHALMNGMELHGLCDGFTDVFDELIFVTDELSAGDIRADIIALGGRQGRYFPVFIELKANRELGRLTDQLRCARKAMEVAGDSFLKLLANATGKPKSDIVFDDAKLLIIWPGSASGKERDDVAKARENGFIVAEYEYDESTLRIIRTT